MGSILTHEKRPPLSPSLEVAHKMHKLRRLSDAIVAELEQAPTAGRELRLQRYQYQRKEVMGTLQPIRLVSNR